MSFADPVNGTDLSIIMADTEFNKRVYKTISAITTRNKSALHTDPIVARQWLDDTTTWREVFKPKTAPGISPYEFLQMASTGNNPYWDDSDAANKHWVFPGRPDLEQAANTRKANLDADGDENFEYASDLEEGPRTTISNITPSTVGKYEEDAVDITAKTQPAEVVDEHEDLAGDPEIASGDYEDLPF